MARQVVILACTAVLSLVVFGLYNYNLGEQQEDLWAGSPGGHFDGQKDIPPSPENQPLPQSVEPQYCKWVFDTYESSTYEEEWFQEVRHVQSVTADGPNICKAMLAEKHIIASKSIIGRAINLTFIDPKVQWATSDNISPTFLHPADRYMSRMHYQRVCYDEQRQEFLPASGHGVQLIEPLFGMLRDPFDVYCGADKLVMNDYPDLDPGQSKLHILPQGYAPYAYTTKDSDDPTNWRTHGIPPWHTSLRPVYNEQIGTSFSTSENIHMDLGSSYFGGWTLDAQAASGHWFYDHYHARGQKFTRFIAVEVETLNDTTAYKQLPEDLVGIYTLMNIPLTMGEDNLNAIEMIKRVVKPEDFFVLKLDIDSAPIEEPMVRNLLADDPENGGASALIDELMFEHHVNYWPLNKSWRIPSNSTEDGDLITSYNLFRNLRKKGIRSHSWP